MHSKKKKILAWVISIAFIAAAFFSLLFLVKEANHECTGENCPICVCIRQAERTLRQLGTGNAGEISVLPDIPSVIMTIFLASLFIPCESLISRKVRLND